MLLKFLSERNLHFAQRNPCNLTKQQRISLQNNNNNNVHNILFEQINNTQSNPIESQYFNSYAVIETQLKS